MDESSDMLGPAPELPEDAPSAELSETKPLSLDERRQLRDATRRAEAVSLRLAGLTLDQIAERLKIAPDSVKDLIERSMRSAAKPTADQDRALEAARLDRAQAAIWSQVLAGDLKAVDTWLKLSTRRSKMLGLDAPLDINLAVNVRHEMVSALEQLERVVLGHVIQGEVLSD